MSSPMITRMFGFWTCASAAPTSASVARAEAATQFLKLNVILLPAEMPNSTGEHVYEINWPVQYHLWYWTIMAHYRTLQFH